jgi:hypothetical protein
MSIIGKKLYVGGDIPEQTLLNAPYDALEADVVEGENTGDRWINREIVYEAGTQPNYFNWTAYNGFVPMTTSSTVEVKVDNGGNREILPAYTATNDIVLRATADGVITTAEVEDWTTNSWYNLYQFSIWVVINGGTKIRLTYGNFSFVKMAHALIDGPPAVRQDPIQWRNFQIGGFLTFPAGTVINEVSLQVKVGFGGNVLNIGRSNLSLIIAEN